MLSAIYQIWNQANKNLEIVESCILPVDDVVTVAIIDALENLFHENSGIFLSELAPCNDFVEQFATLADSIIDQLAVQLSENRIIE